MRIISGRYKGKRLKAPKQLPVRPTTDFAKEGLFNILRNRIDFNEIKVLDLYAGTGNVSFEFASRGACEILAVDSYFGCVKYIEKIARELELPIQVVKADAIKILPKLSGNFNIIFADPPYDIEDEAIAKLIENIFQFKLLKPDGFFIIEHSKHKDLTELEHFTEMRRYGGSVFSFFQ